MSVDLRAAAWAAVDWLEHHTDQAEGDAATASRLRAALDDTEAVAEPRDFQIIAFAKGVIAAVSLEPDDVLSEDAILALAVKHRINWYGSAAPSGGVVEGLPDTIGVANWPGGGGRVSAYDNATWVNDAGGAWVLLYAPIQFYDGLRLRAALGDQDKGDQEEAALRAGGGL